MPFAYYNKLTRSQKAIYRASDRRSFIELPALNEHRSLVPTLKQALELAQQARVRSIANRLLGQICRALAVQRVDVRVLARRPSSAEEELHGLYVLREDCTARITVWMRTARHKRVVAFRTFLRTLLHELCHHLDYTLLKLEDSFHTKGFFSRESGLFTQLVPDDLDAKRPAPVPAVKRTSRAKKKAGQLSIPFKE